MLFMLNIKKIRKIKTISRDFINIVIEIDRTIFDREFNQFQKRFIYFYFFFLCVIIIIRNIAPILSGFKERGQSANNERKRVNYH